MKKLITISLLSLFLSAPLFSFAAMPAGLTPKSPFYFLDTLFERISLSLTFNAEKKAGKALEYANERLAEAKEVANEQNTDAVKTALYGYEKNIAFAAEESKQVQDKDKAERVFNLIADNAAKQQEVLSNVLAKVPEEAKDAITKAIEASKRGQEEALKQIAELRQEVTELKQEIAELRKQQKTELTAPINTQSQSSIQELKKEIEELKKQAEKKGKSEKQGEKAEERAVAPAIPAVSMVRTKIIIKHKDVNRPELFELIIINPTGIKKFLFQPIVGLPYSGELLSCPKEFKAVTVFDPKSFPFKAVITDCENKTDEFDISSEGEYGVLASIPSSVIVELNTWIATQEARIKKQLDVIRRLQTEQNVANASSATTTTTKSTISNALTTEYTLKINALEAKTIEANAISGEEKAKEILRIYGNTNGREYPNFVNTVYQREVVDFIYKKLNVAVRSSNNVVNFFREKQSMLDIQIAKLRNELNRKHIELQSEGWSKEYNLEINAIEAQLIEANALLGIYDWYREILRFYGNSQGTQYPEFIDTDFKKQLVNYIYNKLNTASTRDISHVMMFFSEQTSALNTKMAQLSNEQQRRSLLLETQQKDQQGVEIKEAEQKLEKLEQEKTLGLTNICIKHYGEGSSYNELVKDCQCKGGYLFDKGMCVDQKAKEERLESERKIQDFLDRRDALCKERFGLNSKINTNNTNECVCVDGKRYNIDQGGVSCKQ